MKKKTPCIKCRKFTESIRKSKLKYFCGQCNSDKSLSDYYYYESQLNEQEKL